MGDLQYVGFAEKVFLWGQARDQARGKSLGYLLSLDFMTYSTQNARFWEYPPQKSCTYFLF